MSNQLVIDWAYENGFCGRALVVGASADSLKRKLSAFHWVTLVASMLTMELPRTQGYYRSILVVEQPQSSIEAKFFAHRLCWLSEKICTVAVLDRHLVDAMVAQGWIVSGSSGKLIKLQRRVSYGWSILRRKLN